MRLLAFLGVAGPLAALGVVAFVPEATLVWLDPSLRSILSTLAAAILGVALTALVVQVHGRYRLWRIVRTAEQLAAGIYDVRMPASGGLDGRLAVAVNTIAAALADTHDRATTDKLTGVANRAALVTHLFSEVERAGRYERPLSIAFVDIDHFKMVNDSYGHAAGDEVLRGVAQVIAENLRTSDLIGRYGGEEFMLVLTETTVEDGAALAEKLRTLVQRRRFSVPGNPELSVTISIGLAGGSGARLRMENLIRDADAAMYSAKALGRNQTYIFAEPDDESRVPRAPISASGRARAVALGKAAREAATAALTSVIAPLPHYRGKPSALIASIVVDLASQLDLPPAEVERLKVAALLHDVGKVAVPQEILDKPAALTSSEWRTVVQHPRIGQVILEHAAALKDAVPIILHHHERYAGHGYPYGLRGNEIPLGARIVAIADAYDAMTHDRPYKRAMSHEEAIDELRRHAGTQFDPELVTLFCDLYANRAPEPDTTVLAITAPLTAHNQAPHPLVVADGTTPAVSARRPRRTQATTGDGGAEPDASAGDRSMTMAADAEGDVRLGLARPAPGRPTPTPPRPRRVAG
jgi:diguanylate cyclase (GGDEF)-like protein